MLAVVAVPINTAFGVTFAILLVRSEFRGKTLVMSMLDLPFSISPVVTGGHPGHIQSPRVAVSASVEAAVCLACIRQGMSCHAPGLMLVLLYGRNGWFAPVIRATGFNIVFAFPGEACTGCPPLLRELARPVWPEQWGSGWTRVCRHGAGDPLCDAAICGARAHTHSGGHGPG